MSEIAGHTLSEIEMEQKEEPISRGDVILELAIELANGYLSDLLKLDHNIAQSAGSKEKLITVHS